MNKKVYRIWLALAAISVIIACFIGINYNIAQTNTKKQDIEAKSQQEYLLKAYQDGIGVYKAGENSPFMTIDVYLNSLPEVDRLELATSGVKAFGDEELRRLIEDYES